VISTLPGGQVLDRLVGSPVAEFQFVGPPAQGQSQNLVAQTDAEDGQPAQQLFDRLDAVDTGSGSPGPLERKRPSGAMAMMADASVAAGTTTTSNPARSRQRAILYLRPKSMATTDGRVPALPPDAGIQFQIIGQPGIRACRPLQR
jgi:hypothetical protein